MGRDTHITGKVATWIVFLLESSINLKCSLFWNEYEYYIIKQLSYEKLYNEESIHIPGKVSTWLVFLHFLLESLINLICNFCLE